MQQTLFALAAILAFSYYALSRHQDDAEVERRAVSSEIERALTDAARSRLARIEAKAFDEQDIGTESVRFTPPTSAIGPDAAETAWTAFDDIDDFDGFSETTGVSVANGLPVGGAAAPPTTVEFTVSVSVRYVQTANPSAASAVPSMAKEVHVQAIEALPPGTRTGRPPLRADLRRVYTPAGMAALRPQS